ncbi:hypothetical protein ACHAW5_003255 [Stephanodiscus triporus]|uniref:FAD-binding domain-containing protein n=1 Tax=Stephanodiscus triporus TaxID=2934178 RepID=A0ABD3NLT8_9STRA
MTRRVIALATRLGAAGTAGGPPPHHRPSPSSVLDFPSRRRRRLGRHVDAHRRPGAVVVVVQRGLASSSHYDVIVSGGGSVGSSLARMLLDDSPGPTRRRRRPLRVALLERGPAPPSLRELVDGDGDGGTTTRTPGPRAYALSPASLSCLGPGALRALVKSNRCGVYDSMQIWEHDGPAQLHFTGEDLGRAIEDGRLVDLDGLVNHVDDVDDEEGKGGGKTKDGKENRSASGKRRPWLGAVVEDAPLVSSLWDELRNDDRIDLLDNVRITSIRAPSPGDMGNAEPPPAVRLSYNRSNNVDDDDVGEGGRTTISSDLLVAADGANSQVRRLVGNFPMMTHPYGKKAVTCTVELESSMARTAYQRFLSHGPIALLPVWNSHDEDGGTSKDFPVYANVVWSTTLSEANHLLTLSPSEFTSALNRHLRQGPNVNPSLLPDSNRGIPPPTVPLFSAIAEEVDSLLRTANTALTMGTWTESPSRNHFRMPPRSVRVVGPIMGFDLAMSHVMMTSASGPGGTYGGGYVSPRVALVGDAAHTMHPMAGQGLNLGMSDVASLANLIKEALDSGMDVGGTSLFLDRYNRERMVSGWGIVGGVHGLHEIFGLSGIAPGSVADETYDGGRGIWG